MVFGQKFSRVFWGLVIHAEWFLEKFRNWCFPTATRAIRVDPSGGISSKKTWEFKHQTRRIWRTSLRLNHQNEGCGRLGHHDFTKVGVRIVSYSPNQLSAVFKHCRTESNSGKVMTTHDNWLSLFVVTAQGACKGLKRGFTIFELCHVSHGRNWFLVIGGKKLNAVST